MLAHSDIRVNVDGRHLTGGVGPQRQVVLTHTGGQIDLISIEQIEKRDSIYFLLFFGCMIFVLMLSAVNQQLQM